MAKKLQNLKLKRNKQMTYIHRFKEFIDQVPEHGISKKQFFEIQARLEQLPAVFKQFEAIQSEIDFIDDNDESGGEFRKIFENQYFDLHAQMKEKLASYNENSHVQEAPSHIVQTPIQFPLMNLPTFSGEYHQWPEFRDSFESLIGQNKSFTNIQKFHHLRSCLKEDVLDTIKSIPVTNENFEIALQRLTDRYDKKHLISRNHVNAILEFPKILKESGLELRNLHNCINNNLEALKHLGIAVNTWDLILIPLVTAKLDLTTLREWEKHSTNKKQVKFQELLSLINDRAEFLESMELNKNLAISREKKSNVSSNKIHSRVHLQINQQCNICKGEHPIFKCSSFLELAVKDRIKRIKEMKLCINCLKGSHFVRQCTSSKCRKCGKSHNTLLHLEKDTKVPTVREPKLEESTTVATTQIHSSQETPIPSNHVILPTAMILVADKNNKWHQCRALLDSGAMSNFITRKFFAKLGLPFEIISCQIKGVGSSIQNVHHQAKITFYSTQRTKTPFKENFLILDNITSNLPLIEFNKNNIQIPKNLTLADPLFNQSGPIDMLLGSSIFWQLLESGRITIPETQLVLQQTKLGWIMGGSHPNPRQIKVQSTENVNCTAITQLPLETQIRKFWEVEEVEVKPTKSPEEQYCEESFLHTHRRDANGHFIVKIPFKSNLSQLGPSKHLAKKRFENLEKRLIKNPNLYSEYSKIMTEYISMGHMKEIKNDEELETASYYIPHHAVIRQDSITTKVRIVFDASMATTSGLSLNDVQYVGPTIQNDLFSILVNFRLHKYVMSGDISKMYRMVWLHDEHKPFHRIFWREASNLQLKCYELQTVTFGTASAPFLAIRSLHQLAIENSQKYPEASKLIQNNFYVDDLIFGTESRDEMIRLQHEITDILASAGFHLRKWLCNKKEIYPELKLNKELECSTIQFGEKEHKLLGISWHPNSDQMVYSEHQFSHQPITKRKILSDLSKVFDPLGIVGPIIVVGKLIMQDLWQEQISWDEPVPLELLNRWSSFKNELESLHLIKTDRKVLADHHKGFELHGFCDASQRAYGACIFARSKDDQGKIHVKLLCSKSRVAPLKTISLPRLELNAALLLSQLTKKVLQKLEIRPNAIHYWSDSTIALSWIRGSPSRWKTFVANRVGEIQQLTSIDSWHHVTSSDNPADILSRGTTTKQLLAAEIWWSGPSWLSTDNLPFHKTFQIQNELPEENVLAYPAIQDMVQIQDLFVKYSNFDKLQRITAYCLRFKQNCKTPKNERHLGELTVDELEGARKSLLRIMQQEAFSKEYHALSSSKELHNQSRLRTLNPFFDKDNLIRVGGRLQKTQLSFDTKHPIILAPNHLLTKLIVKSIHNENLHCGPSALLSFTRQRYWPIDGRNLVKGVVRGCRVCFLAKPKPSQYLMGQLPGCRVTPNLPFQDVGIDYAGPISIKDRKTRNPKILKAYICLFVCMSTKAIHLECVSDLSTESFILCLKRFVSRRGKPNNMYSDNAKNFVGANLELKKIHNFINQNFSQINQFLSNRSITWHFIPPRSPSFGGIWEAGIKSVKSHLYKVTRNIKFDYEQLSTLLCQIEAVLNSRPLTPMSTDPSDLTPLTPGHFLIGRAINQHPEISHPSLIPTSRLKQFRHLETVISHFWKRWSTEYIHQLQTRTKWNRGSSKENAPIQVGKLVVLQEDTNPLQWPLGRITELHPGADGVVRVVSIRVRSGIVKRSVSKICILPDEV